MSDIFLPNCRIEKSDNGVRFYEQDVLCGNYIFSGDIDISITADIEQPGFGIVLFKDNLKEALKANNVCILKFGYMDFTVLRKSFSTYSIPVHSSCSIVPPSLNTKIRFTKIGAKITAYINGIKSGTYTMKEAYDSYRIGFYSNGGNTIKDANILGGIPKKWTTNVKNTEGGRVKFFLNGFTLENCNHDLEVEQDTIPISKGTYYIDYIKDNDEIDNFIFFYNDKEVDDKKKNIVDISNKKFVIDDDGFIDVKFKGRTGTIKNVAIKDDPSSSYVQTDDTAIVVDGSWIKINMNGLVKIRWKGVINAIPDQSDLTKAQDYALVETSKCNYKIGDLNVNIGSYYDYVVDVNKLSLSVSNKIKNIVLDATDNNTITVFNDVNAKITELILTDTSGNEINVIIQKTYKFYVPEDICGPIIVTDENEAPLDISSSYREIDDEYIFTNWEREIFDSKNPLYLEKEAAGKTGDFIIYGIEKDIDINIDNIYRIQDKTSIHSIDLLTSKYSVIKDYMFNDDDNSIVLNDDDISKYSKIVVDYLKKDSYCINLIEEINSYEVDISSSLNVLYIVHEKDTSNGYIKTSISCSDNKYIVLRKAV